MSKNNCMNHNNNYCQSQFLPLSLCNFRKLNEMNNDIFIRQFPNEKLPITYSFRPIVQSRADGTQTNQILRDQINTVTTTVNDNNINNLNTIFNPGNGSYYGFCKNINNDSDLKDINRNYSNCPTKKYIPSHINNTTQKINNLNQSIKYDTQKLNMNMKTCNQKSVVPIQDNINYNYFLDNNNPNQTKVGIQNITNNITNNNNQQIINKDITICNNSSYLSKCKNDNYMRGYFIASDKTDITAQLKGYHNINTGENQWVKYKNIIENNEKDKYNIQRGNFNTLPFMLNSYGIPHNDYLSNEQQCQNLFNNNTKVKTLYGKPFH